MNLKTLNKKLAKLFGDRVKATENKNSIILTGDLDNNQDIVKAGYLAVEKKSNRHVVNDITLNGKKRKPMELPEINDKSLDGYKCDVLVIGGGISGSSILRELSKWNLNLLLVEKEADLANQASGRNDGQVHPGVDLKKGTLKQSLVKAGNRSYDQISKELDVPFKRVGQYGAFTTYLMLPFLWLFGIERKYHCGIDDTMIVTSKFIKKKEPNYNPKFKCAIHNPMAGVTSPYNLTIAYAENAVENGAKVSLNTAVLSMKVNNEKIESVETNRGTIYPRFVINAAGVFCDTVAGMANDRFYSVHPRKGTIEITDKKINNLSNGIASIQKIIKPKNQRHTKGGGTIHTVHDNLLLGPDAVEIYDYEDVSTNQASIITLNNKQKETVNGLKNSDAITYFSGVRASTYEEDYIIERGRNTKNLYHVAGIQSPGLTTAPVVAKMVEKEVVEILKNEYMEVKENKTYNPYRKGIPHLNELSLEERNKLIKQNPDYGVIVCRCEEISKGEIIDCLERPIKVPTIDGIKRRVRPGMGRCQGSFCMPIVSKIIAEHENIPLKDVLKRSSSSSIGYRDTKESE